MRWLRAIAFNAYYWSLTIGAALACTVLLILPLRDPLRFIMMSWARAVIWGMRVVGGMRIDVRGREHLPSKGPALIASKHQSECDGILLAALVNDIAFVAMKELFSWPLIGPILYRLQMVRVDTCGGERERRNLAHFCRRAYENGRVIAIYPEGHLMPIGQKERYRTGIYYLSRDLNLPVTPVALSVGLLWSRWQFWKRPGRAAIQFLPPIPPSQDKDAFMARLEDEIERATAALVAEATGQPVELARYVPRSPPRAPKEVGAAPFTSPQSGS